jgi:hypothetical protein
MSLGFACQVGTMLLRYPLGIGLSFIFLVRAFGASAPANGAQRCG